MYVYIFLNSFYVAALNNHDYLCQILTHTIEVEISREGKPKLLVLFCVNAMQSKLYNSHNSILIGRKKISTNSILLSHHRNYSVFGGI